jgi:hypothetical protein
MPSGRVLTTAIVLNPDHLAGTECVSLRRDYRCALRLAGEALGQHPGGQPFLLPRSPAHVRKPGTHDPGCQRSTDGRTRELPARRAAGNINPEPF